MPTGRCSTWAFHGFGDDAFDESHVSSNKMSPDRVPELGKIKEIGFRYAISSHLKQSADVIEVGGGSDRRLREQLAAVLEDAVQENWDAEHRDSEITFQGHTERNVVNWLPEDSTSGVQIELPIYAARNSRKRISRNLPGFFQR